MTATTSRIQHNPWPPRLAAGNWRVDPARSHASFAARVAGCLVRGSLPLAGGAAITEPIEDATARLAARRCGTFRTRQCDAYPILAGPVLLNFP